VIVIVVSACPAGLRGQLTRWLMEVSAGVFVGRATARVRDELWDRVIENIGNGRGLLTYSAPGEQGLVIRNCGHHWAPEDFDGITLMRRPPGGESADAPPVKKGWSQASRRRRG